MRRRVDITARPPPLQRHTHESTHHPTSHRPDPMRTLPTPPPPHRTRLAPDPTRRQHHRLPLPRLPDPLTPQRNDGQLRPGPISRHRGLWGGQLTPERRTQSATRGQDSPALTSPVDDEPEGPRGGRGQPSSSSHDSLGGDAVTGRRRRNSRRGGTRSGRAWWSGESVTVGGDVVVVSTAGRCA